MPTYCLEQSRHMTEEEQPSMSHAYCKRGAKMSRQWITDGYSVSGVIDPRILPKALRSAKQRCPSNSLCYRIARHCARPQKNARFTRPGLSHELRIAHDMGYSNSHQRWRQPAVEHSCNATVNMSLKKHRRHHRAA
jgi:hypothetical protein